MASIHTYDLILLDIMLPLKDGISVCKYKPIFTLPLSCSLLKIPPKIKSKGLDIGANDYLAKPFSFAELLARIRVQLRAKDNFSTTLCIGDLELDLLKKTAKRGNDTIVLTAKEFSLLEYLIKNKDRV